MVATLVLWVALLGAPFGAMAIVNGMAGPSNAAQAPLCSRHCHNHGCSHNANAHDWDKPIPKAARAIYHANIQALRSTPLGYQNTNLVVYVLGLPLVYAALLLAVLWPRRPKNDAVPSSKLRWGVAAAMGALCGGGAVTFLTTGGIAAWGWPGGSAARAVYWYCTDFCIHAANGMGINYEEFNFALFVLGFPLTLLILVAWVSFRIGSRWWR